MISESLGINAYEVRELVNTLPNDPSNPDANPVRNLHIPGAGVGGHCLPKDSWLLKYGLDNYGKIEFMPDVIVKSRELNMWMPVHMFELLQEALAHRGKQIGGSKIAVLGVAFLENSDDTRNTPTEPFYKLLKDAGAERYTKEAAMAKYFAAEACMYAVREAVQIYGGYGYTKDYPVERYFRDAKVMEIYEGTSEIQKIVIARSLLA